MRRRKGRKYTWMPILGGVGGAGAAANTTVVGDVIIPFANGNVAQYVTPVVPDETEKVNPALAESQSLRDLTEGQDWFLKRIVGKLTLAVEASHPDGTTNWPNVVVAAAFFVARANDDNVNELDMTSDEVDPLNAWNIRQPYIWRRSWILSNTAEPTSPTGKYMGPGANWQYGSALDGPHIDAKTARRIRREERLWFTLSAMGFADYPGDVGARLPNSRADAKVE